MDCKLSKEYLKICEWPFVREGMTIEEFDEEMRYYGTHREEVHNRTYKPLWKQREEENNK